jgi:hypothetical protein
LREAKQPFLPECLAAAGIASVASLAATLVSVYGGINPSGRMPENHEIHDGDLSDLSRIRTSR